jgi:hypothetical protein
VPLPKAWRVEPEQTQQELSLLSSGFPIMRPAFLAVPRFSKPEHWVLRQLGWQPSDFLPAYYALCTAEVNEWTLKPVDKVSCRLYRFSTAGSAQQRPEGRFTINRDSLPPGNYAGSRPTRAELEASFAAAAAAKAEVAGKCPHLGPGLVLGPLRRWISAQARRWRPTAIAAKVLSRMWHVVVPTGSFARPLCALFSRLHLLAYDRPFNVAVAHTLSEWRPCAPNRMFLLQQCWQTLAEQHLHSTVPVSHYHPVVSFA